VLLLAFWIKSKIECVTGKTGTICMGVFPGGFSARF